MRPGYAGAGLLWAAGIPMARADGQPELTSALEMGGSGGYIGLVYLALFLLFLGAVYVFVKRGHFPRARNGGSLSILETKMLGGRQFLVVGQYEDRRFLLGVCPGKIEYLHDLGRKPEEPAKKTFDRVLHEQDSRLAER